MYICIDKKKLMYLTIWNIPLKQSRHLFVFDKMYFIYDHISNSNDYISEGTELQKGPNNRREICFDDYENVHWIT